MSVTEVLPLTAAQRDIWLDQIGHGDSPLYTIGGYVDLQGPLRPELLEQALTHLLRAHDALRTVLVPAAPGSDTTVPGQRFVADLPLDLPLYDLSQASDPVAAAQAQVRAALQHHHALDGGPLLHFSLVRLAADRHWLITHAHHLILDGWGFGQMLKALGEHYTALTQNLPLPGAAASYAAFVADDQRYQASERYLRDKAYWLDKYRHLPAPLLAPRRQLRRASDPSPAGNCMQVFPAELHARMQRFAEIQGASAFHVLLAALHLYVCRVWQRQEWVVGVPMLNRSGHFKSTLGHFAQVSAVHLATPDDLTFEALVRRVRDTLRRDLRHQRFPLSDLNRHLGLAREERAQLFEVSVSYEQDNHQYAYGQAQADTVKVSNGHEATPLAIHVRSNRQTDSAWLHLVHHRGWLDDDEAQALAARLLQTLDQGLAAPDTRLSQFELLTPAEQRQLDHWNRSELPAAGSRQVHRRIERQAQLRPQQVAAVHGEAQLTYAELDQRASALADHLRGQGAGPEQRVAVLLERGLDLMVGLLAIFKAGAAYVPIDPALPGERIAYLLEDSAPCLLLSLSSLRARRPDGPLPVLELDALPPLGAEDGLPPVSTPSEADLAYVIYTSGSTGLPKGVMIEQRMLANLVDWHLQAFDLGPGHHTSCLAGLSFDAMAWEVWPALCAGATLHLAPAQPQGENIDALLRWWRAQPLDVSFLPTPVAEYAFGLADDHPTLRVLLIGGDRLRQLPSPRRYRVINNYGPTETTVVASSGQVSADRVLHIGAPVANTQLHVLDAQGRRLPIGAVGELYIGGVGVARGYLGRPDLTAERFVADPFSDRPEARLYRSGDLVRWLPDGTLEYLGRNDDQVKVRGMRIELGEIEAALTAQPGLQDAVVLVRDERLLAWYTTAEGVSPDPQALRQALRQRLPAHMVPVAFTALAHWPLTANGKLDRRALPAPDPTQMSGQAHEPPQGPLEVAMAALWCDVLQVPKVGRHDNFFELGGHSLLAVTLVDRLRQAGLPGSVHQLLSHPTLAELAALERHTAPTVEVPANRVPPDAEHITPAMLSLTTLDQAAIDRIVATVPGGAANVQEIYPLSPVQAGITYHHLRATHGDPYLLRWRLAFDSLARLTRWATALQQVIDRHDILRSAVCHEGLAQPHQVVWRQAPLTVEAVELPDITDGDTPLAQLQAHVQAHSARLPLHQAPLMRLSHAQDRLTGETVAILLFHHLILDNQAMVRVAQELASLLEQPDVVLPEPVPYRQYIAQVGRADQAAQTAFFEAMLGDVDEPTLPCGLAVREDDTPLDECRRPLSPALNQALREQARRQGVSVASLVHLAWARVVGVLAGRDDVVFGTVLLGRMQGGDARQALGVFINTLPLRIDTTQDARQALRDVHGRLNALLAHEDASLALAQRCADLPKGATLFSALLNYRHSAEARPQDGEGAWAGVRVLDGEVRSHYPLTLSVDDLNTHFDLQVLAVPTLGAACVTGWVETALARLVDALAQATPGRVDRVSILDDAAQAHLLQRGHAPRAYPRGLTVHALIEAQAAQRPSAPALRQGDVCLSYAQLNQQANRLAHTLLAHGVCPEDRVAVCLGNTPNRVVGLLAVLKAGAGYVPVDPGYPAERVAYLLSDAAPRLVLTDDATQARVGDGAQLNLDRFDGHGQSAQNPRLPGLDDRHLAYVIYTSGSTGQPKGVMVEHASLVNLVHWHAEAFGLQAGSQTASVAGFSFDAAAWETWPALCQGAVLHLPPRGLVSEALEDLLAWWQRTPIEVGFLPTPVAEHWLRGAPHHPTLRTLLIGGDRLRQFDRDPGFAVINNYGPTETTVVATSGRLQPGGALHIGGPIANARLYVLDAGRQPVPVGVVGELYIGGEGVARGYLGQPALSAERFLDDPFVAGPDAAGQGARMYRSGDRVRWREDGALDYLGRVDAQVKLRGMRIEPGEIEAALLAQPGVESAVVLVRDGRLLAWFTGDAAVTPAALRDGLQHCLPGHMVPSAFTALAALPLTRNGKLDPAALPEPTSDSLVGQGFEAPHGALEMAIAAVWAEVLGLARVGRHDDFFELGGHSLLAVSLVERLRERGLGIDVRVLLARPTVAALASGMGPGDTRITPPNRVPDGCTHITPALLALADLDQASIDRIVAQVPGGAANVQEIYPLAPLQQGILYHHFSTPEHDPYLLHLPLRFDSLARLQQVAAVLQRSVTRHDSLRTAIVWAGLETAHQVVLRQAALRVEQVPVALLGEAHARRPMALDQAPLIELWHAAPDAEGTVQAILRFHHVVLDALALDVLREEWLDDLAGQGTPHAPAVPYRNYVDQACQGAAQADHEAFFRAQLGDIDTPTLAFDTPGVVAGPAEQARRALPQALVERLRRQAQACAVSLASLFHLAWARVLGVACDSERVVFGTVLLGRLQGGQGADCGIGMFINTLPLRVELGERSVHQALRDTHARLLALLAHEQAPLALAQRWSGVPAPLPLFNAMLNYRHAAGQARQDTRQAAWEGIDFDPIQAPGTYALTLDVDDFGSAVHLGASAPGSVGAARLAGLVEQALASLSEALDADPERPVQQVAVLDEATRHRMLATANDTAQDHDLTQTVPALFADQVRRRPEAIALYADGVALRYRDLEAQANAVAHHLLAHGLGRDDRVALCVERGPAMVVGLLAILKAGGAYVPLDPSYPAERLRTLLDSSTPRAVLVHGATRGRLALAGQVVIDLDALEHLPTQAEAPVCRPSAHDLAYVIHTSGSTGVPKGVMVEHRQVVNLVQWARRVWPETPERVVLHKTAISFDASVWELLWPLCSGVPLVLARPDGQRDPAYLTALIRQHQVSVVQFVPALLAQFLDDDGCLACTSLVDIVCGGGELTAALAAQVRQRMPWARLHNVYGPTETTVDCSLFTLHPEQPVPATALPIGQPIDNTRLYVLDAQLQPVPEGVPGQLYIGGAGVTRGYLNRPDEQAQRFIDSPFAPGERLYASGDRVQRRLDGELMFLGRNDDQLKLNGLRVEPGDIEHSLLRVPGIEQAVVLARADALGAQRLVAWYSGTVHTAAALRAALLEQLPDYLVPALFMHLTHWPLSPNGKLDRRALPTPDAHALPGRAFEAPSGEVEVLLAQVWAELLGVEQVGRHDNFFELGGHSLLAVNLIARLRQEGLEADVRALFEHPTLAGYAAITESMEIIL
ncbi:amino acid adenylation domain-containing protein [Pseudomonas entomophila]|uniref:non-ribosomal peptide synthetase n=1 Tax=Pseudomonas entomophila TaxID=312306 RepID=UPI0015E3050E|nr:non-ribosomal peptide synthetase [Pseudomonas entomophila]MBA1188073.1 amino acid adenylation domain-containing protein [Pseudomonas entomophila]